MYISSDRGQIASEGYRMIMPFSSMCGIFNGFRTLSQAIDFNGD
jgi:hypothetical protein